MPYICTTKNETNASAEVSDGDDLVAQLVEHNTFNVGVLGSSPSGITEVPDGNGRHLYNTCNTLYCRCFSSYSVPHAALSQRFDAVSVSP